MHGLRGNYRRLASHRLEHVSFRGPVTIKLPRGAKVVGLSTDIGNRVMVDVLEDPQALDEDRTFVLQPADNTLSPDLREALLPTGTWAEVIGSVPTPLPLYVFMLLSDECSTCKKA